MKKALIVALCLLALPACAAEFHPPQTGAEKALEHIFSLYKNNKQNDLDGFIFGYRRTDISHDAEFRMLFTQAFTTREAQKERQRVARSCNGKYPSNGLPCDVTDDDINPIYCAQDQIDDLVYRTVNSSASRTIVTYAWKGDNTGWANYIFVQEDGQWKLDDIDCNASKKEHASTDSAQDSDK